MVATIEQLFPAIADAGDAGISLAKLKVKFAGRSQSKAKVREVQLHDALKSLTEQGKVRGPVKYAGSQYFFSFGHGPSIETVAAVVLRELRDCGTKLLSRPRLEKKIVGLNRPFFADAVKHAVANRLIAELACGTSRYYLHRDVAAECFALEAGEDTSPPSGPELRLEDLLPIYRRLKAEQGGFGTVNISDLMKGEGIRKDILHRLLLREAKDGRLTIHPSTAVRLPAEVTAAGIRLSGFAEPFVTVVIKDDA